MPKALLVDTNVSSSPIYNYLIESGNEVFVIGGNPADFLAKSAAHYINADYSKVDETRELIGKLGIDFIVPGCNDRSYQVCAELNSGDEFPGIDSLDATEKINNKEKFREFAMGAGLPVPRILSEEQAGQAGHVIVKPVDAYSGRGITVLRESIGEGLRAAVDNARSFSLSKTCIIEEFVEGQLYSHTAFIANGAVIADFVVEEHGTANPYVVDTSRVAYDFPLGMLVRIRDCVLMMAKKLKLVDGLVHSQFIKNKQDFWLIEVTRRCPGDLYSQLIELSTGFSYAETYARPFLNQPLAPAKQELMQNWIMRHTISQPVEGFLGSLRFKLPLRVEKFVSLSLAGDKIMASPFGRVGILFTSSDSKVEFEHLYQQTLKRNLYVIDA